MLYGYDIINYRFSCYKEGIWMGILFKPAWMGDDEQRALDAVRKISNQKKLAAVAKDLWNCLNKVRVEAVSRISDQRLLADIAKEYLQGPPYTKEEIADDKKVRLAAVACLNDPQLLKEVAEKGDVNVSLAAVARLNDPQLLKEVAESRREVSIGIAAADKIADPVIAQKIYYELAVRHCSPEAISKITDPEKIYRAVREIRKYNRCSISNMGLYSQIRDDRILASLAFYDSASATSILGLIKDASILKKAEQEHEEAMREAREEEVRAEKLRQERIRAEELKKQHEICDYLSGTGKIYHDLRLLTNEKLITELAFKGIDKWVREDDRFCEICMPKIKNRDTLRKIAVQSPTMHVRWMACKLSGGHYFDESAVNKCKCTVCGIEYHAGCPNNGNDWACRKCGGTVHTIPFVEGLPHSLITYPDGTTGKFHGYSGLYSDEGRYI